jgi:hypothetical protein
VFATFEPGGILALNPRTSGTTYLLRYPLIAVVLRLVVHIVTFIAFTISPGNIFSVETNTVVVQDSVRRDAAHSTAIPHAVPISGRYSLFGWCLNFATNLADGLLIVPIVYHSGVVCAPFIVVVVLLYTMAPVLLSSGSLFTIFVLNTLRVFMVVWIFISAGTYEGQANTIAFTLVDLLFSPCCLGIIIFLSSTCEIEAPYVVVLNGIVFFIRFCILLILSVLAGVHGVSSVHTVCEAPSGSCNVWS